jgi:hypothetical protein
MRKITSTIIVAIATILTVSALTMSNQAFAQRTLGNPNTPGGHVSGDALSLTDPNAKITAHVGPISGDVLSLTDPNAKITAHVGGSPNPGGDAVVIFGTTHGTIKTQCVWNPFDPC